MTYIAHGAVVLSRNTTDAWPFGPDCPEPAQGRTPRQMSPLMHVQSGLNITVTGGGTVDGLGELSRARARTKAPHVARALCAGWPRPYYTPRSCVDTEGVFSLCL